MNEKISVWHNLLILYQKYTESDGVFRLDHITKSSDLAPAIRSPTGAARNRAASSCKQNPPGRCFVSADVSSCHMESPHRPEVLCSVAGPAPGPFLRSDASPAGPVASPSHGSAGPWLSAPAAPASAISSVTKQPITHQSLRPVSVSFVNNSVCCSVNCSLNLPLTVPFTFNTWQPTVHVHHATLTFLGWEAELHWKPAARPDVQFESAMHFFLTAVLLSARDMWAATGTSCHKTVHKVVQKHKYQNTYRYTNVNLTFA